MAAPARLLPVRDISQASRLSQGLEGALPKLKQNILGRFPDKFNYYNTRYPFDLDVVLNTKEQTGIHYGPHNFDWSLVSTDKPTVFYVKIRNELPDTHALLVIYFPKEDLIDIVSTYSIDADSMMCFYNFFSGMFGRKVPIVNDVACLADNPRRLRSSDCYNLQSEDTAAIGWCLAWMVYLSDVLSQKSAEEFWNRDWPTRRVIYKDLYDKLTTTPDFNSMKVGAEVWNAMTSKYYRGGRRKTRKPKRLRSRRVRRS